MNPAKEWLSQVAEPVFDEIDGKPAVVLPGNGLLVGDFAAELGRLLADAGVFARQGCAFTLNHEGQKLEAVTPGWLRTWIEQHVVPYRLEERKDGGNKTITVKIKRSITEDIAKAVNVSPQFLGQLYKVERFHPCPMPVMREDGSIELLKPGMDLESFTYTADAGLTPELLTLDEACSILRDLLAEFAWPEDEGRSFAVHVAAMMTVFAGSILPYGTICPVFIYLGNGEGAGKTLLASLAGIPYSELPAGEPAPQSEEEWQKKLLALTVSGRRLVLLDNLKRHLDSPALEAYVTSPTYAGRILGVTREFCGEAGATLLVTGNRLTISPDMRRRALIVELFMPELRAEDRKFKRILDAEAIRELRPAVVSALWSIVHCWDQAGRPPCSQINASFPRWSKVIAGIVEFAGFGSPLAPAEVEGMGDTDTADFAELVTLMEPGTDYKFADVAGIANDAGLFDHILSDRDSSDGLTPRAKSKLSNVLKRYAGRRIDSSTRFVVEGKGHSRRYRLHGLHGPHGVSPDKKKGGFPKAAKGHANHADHANTGAEVDEEDQGQLF